MSKTFLNISKIECLNIYQEIVENSNSHFQISELAANDSKFGIAISHLILSSEELVKGIIIFLDGNGLQIRKATGVKKFFTNHEVRHTFSVMFLAVSTVLIPITILIKNFKESDDPSLFKKMQNANSNNDQTQVKKLTVKLLTKFASENFEKLSDYFDFWNDAEILKQKGFYVDYKNKLLLPKHLTNEDYMNAKQITEKFIDDGKKFIAYINSLNAYDKKYFINLINNDKQIYSMFEKFSPKKQLPITAVWRNS